MLQYLDDFIKSDQHWYVTIDSHVHTTQYKGQLGRLPWELADSKGRTAGCWVSKNGEFHLCTRGSDVDDVMGNKLPADRPLWGFVAFYGEWEVEANYKIVMSKGEAVVHSMSPSCYIIPCTVVN